MAKEKAKPEKATTKEEAKTFKYGVADLAEKMGIEPASVRVQLRNKKIKKAGKSYGWDSKADLQEVLDELKAEAPAKAKKAAKAEVAPKGKAGKKAADEPAPKTGKKGKKPPVDDDDD